MNAVLASIGTDGDVHPYVGLGARLLARGHRVTLVAPERYRAVAVRWGLKFEPLMSDAEYREVIEHPDFWRPLKGPRVAARWGTLHLPREYELLNRLSAPADSVMVASAALLTGRLLQEQYGRPLATLMLQPGLIPSSKLPPIMPAGLTLPRGAPRWVAAAYWRAIDAAGDLLVGRHLNRLRATLGLGPVRRLFRWWSSPRLVLGMFPDWYGPPQPDWPPQLRLVGFPLFDAHPDAALDEAVEQFCAAGEAPVAFTFGTGMTRPDRLFRAAVEACRIAGARGILLTRHRQAVPPDLPASILHCDYARFRALFPRCAAVVHHGGVGTVAEALAAGTPQLVLPIAYDQFDNAARVRRLGAGDFLRPGRATPARIAAALRRVTAPGVGARCRKIATGFGGRAALDIAAEQIEGLASGA